MDQLCHCELEVDSEWGPHTPDYHDSAEMPLVMVIDGNNMLMRCVKATERAGLVSDQISTGALMAFIGALSRCVREHEPEFLVICWDDGPSKYRLEIYPEYKAARADKPVDENKEYSFGLAKKFCEVAGIQQVAVSGFEADDVVAAYWAALNNHRMMIVSGDKDFFQLLDHGTKQLRPDGVGGYQIWTYKEVQEKYGCLPRQLPSLMALMGDPVDGIPGVHGIGPKKALSGLQAADWNLRRVEALNTVEKRSVALLSYELVNLRDRSIHPKVPLIQKFQPVRPEDGQGFMPMLTFCKSLELESVLTKVYTGTLWS